MRQQDWDNVEALERYNESDTSKSFREKLSKYLDHTSEAPVITLNAHISPFPAKESYYAPVTEVAIAELKPETEKE